MRSVALVLVALAHAAGVAAAGGSLETPAAAVVVEDGFADCAAPLAGFCFADADASGAPGAWNVDAYQRITYVGVAVNGSLAGVEDRGAFVEGRELYVEHPVFPTATWAWDGVRDDVPLPEGFDVRSTREGVTVDYVGPSAKDLGNPVAPRSWSYEHGDDEGLGYDRAGPFLQPYGEDSDQSLRDLPYACLVLAVDACPGATRTVGTHAMEAAPNVRFGFEFYDVEVASDPDDLGRDGPRPNETRLPPHARPPGEALSLPERRGQPVAVPGPADPGAQPAPARGRGDAAGARADPPAPPGGATVADGRSVAAPLLAAAAVVVGAFLFLAFALYTRLARNALHRQETRQAILRTVEARPGIRLVDLVEEVGRSRSAVSYHVRVMERAGLLDVVERGARKCVAPKGMGSAVAATGVRVRGHPARSLLVDAVRAAPGGLSREDAHRILADVPRRTRNHTIRVLVRAGILREAAGPDGASRLVPGAALP